MVEFWYSSKNEVQLRDQLLAHSAIEVQTGCQSQINNETGFSANLPEIQRAHQDVKDFLQSHSFADLQNAASALFVFFKPKISSFKKIRILLGKESIEFAGKEFISTYHVEVNIQDFQPKAHTLALTTVQNMPKHMITEGSYSLAQIKDLAAKAQPLRAELSNHLGYKFRII